MLELLEIFPLCLIKNQKKLNSMVYCLTWLDMEGNLTIISNQYQSKPNKINQNQTRAN